MPILTIILITLAAFVLAAFIDFVSAYNKEDYEQKVRRMIYKGKTPSKMDAVYCLTQMTAGTEMPAVRLYRQVVTALRPMQSIMKDIDNSITSVWWFSLSDSEKSKIMDLDTEGDYDSWFIALNPKDKVSVWRIYTNSYKHNYE